MKDLKIPDTWASLPEFAAWFAQNGYPVRVPQDARVFVTDVSLSFCTFRHGEYQAELYLAKPGFESSRHSHPFEQLIIFLGGEAASKRGDGQSETPYYHLTTNNSGMVCGVLPVGIWHQILSGEKGFAFYNLQRWRPDQKMTSAVVEYGGEPLGPEHARLMSKDA